MSTFADRMIGAARLDGAIYEEVEADRTATTQAMAVVLMSSAAAGLGALWYGGITGLVRGAVVALLGWLLWAAIIYVVGTRLFPEPQTKSDVGELLRTTGFAATPGLLRVLAVIPFLGWLVSLVAFVWMLAAMVIAVKHALDYTKIERAIGVCLIGWIAFLIVSALFGGLAWFHL
jgi:hypothetical protein